jgi:HlyD family secretion protein
MARRRRRLVIVLSMAALLGLTLAAVMVARSARSPGQIASSATPPGPSTVTVPVTAEPHTLTAVATGSVSEQVVARLVTPQSPAAEGALPVLTKVPVSAGDSFSPGDVVAEISGRPLIVLPGRFPLYRDIHRGDTGPDVLQLRRGLAAVGLTRQAGSTWDASAEQALGQLYASRGYAVAEDLVGGRGATARPPGPARQQSRPLPRLGPCRSSGWCVGPSSSSPRPWSGVSTVASEPESVPRRTESWRRSALAT